MGRGLCLEDELHHKDEFLTAFLAVNDRRRVFRPRRDITHFSLEPRRDTVHGHLRLVARMDGAKPLLRHEGAHLDVVGWQQDDDWTAGRHPFTLPIQRVVYEAGLWRLLTLLPEVPFGPRQGGLSCTDLGFSCEDLIRSRAEQRGV